MRGQLHVLAALYPQERPNTHCTESWVGPRVGLDRYRNSHPPPGFDPWTVQPVASRYTNYATRPTSFMGISLNLLSDYYKEMCATFLHVPAVENSDSLHHS